MLQVTPSLHTLSLESATAINFTRQVKKGIYREDPMDPSDGKKKKEKNSFKMKIWTDRPVCFEVNDGSHRRETFCFCL